LPIPLYALAARRDRSRAAKSVHTSFGAAMIFWCCDDFFERP
jgi:hypothetical protein